MCCTIEWLRVERSTNVDVQGRATLISFVVMDQNDTKLVAEDDALVLAIVRSRLYDFCVVLLRCHYRVVKLR